MVPPQEREKKKPPATFNVVVIGDGAVGKTSLLQRFSRDFFPGFYIPTVLEPTQVELSLDDSRVVLNLIDTPGEEWTYEPRRCRPRPYPKADAAVICFSVEGDWGLSNVEEYWTHEAGRFRRDLPVVLVCTKTDLREDERAIEEMRRNGWAPVQHEDGEKVAGKIKAYDYVECSAKTGSEVRRVFESAARAASVGRRNRRWRKECCIS